MNPAPWSNPHKRRRGLARVWHATGHSLRGLRAGWDEAAFRLEVWVALLLFPLAFWLGRGWAEVSLLLGSLVLVLVVELLNTGIETVTDRIGTDFHELSGRAKDLGSAAVMLSLLLCAAVWLAAIGQRLMA